MKIKERGFALSLLLYMLLIALERGFAFQYHSGLCSRKKLKDFVEGFSFVSENRPNNP